MSNLIDKLKSRITESATYQRLRELSHHKRMPGIRHLPLALILKNFFQAIHRGQIITRASSISFHFLLAIFPSIIVFFTLIPYVPISDFQDTLLETLQRIIPERAYEMVESTIIDIVKRPRGGLLSISFILALYFATIGINNVIAAFNKSYHDIGSRSVFKQYFISLALVFILSFIIITAIALITLGPVVLNILVKYNVVENNTMINIILLVKWVIIVLMFFFAYSVLYYFAPAHKTSIRYITAGAILATLLTLVTSVGFNFYVNNFSRFNALYGSIGTIIVLMLYILFNANIILLGFEFNVSIEQSHRQYFNLGNQKSTAPN
ncbi:MAG: YihY/virulence factor BrkB family protein [Bacteroidales bacterium]|nr:YihY/virulence factor BrkB family protein [Bacteroidales bacterium]